MQTPFTTRTIFSLVLFLVFTYHSCLATKITSKVCGEWSDSTTWDLNRLPNSTDTIIVNSFVVFNTDFASASPGILYVSACGTLCGTASYTGCLTFEGVVFAKTLTLIYGHSAISSSINIQSSVKVNPPASLSVTGATTCVGCISPCKNCNIFARSVPCSTVGLTELLQRGRISLFPNPALSELTISGIERETDLEIYDMAGNLILAKSISCNVTLDLHEILNGIYLLRANTGTNISTHKIIVCK